MKCYSNFATNFVKKHENDKEEDIDFYDDRFLYEWNKYELLSKFVERLISIDDPEFAHEVINIYEQTKGFFQEKKIIESEVKKIRQKIARKRSQKLKDRNFVIQAINQFDNLKLEAFLEIYPSFEDSRDYSIYYEEKEYPPKPIFAAAHGFAYPNLGPLVWDDLTSEESRKYLKKLGFKIITKGGNKMKKSKTGNKQKETNVSRDTSPKNIILYGPPGTGKTRELRKKYIPNYSGRYEFVTSNQSYSYEDFIEGIRPKAEGQIVTYPVKSGIFKKLCKTAKDNPDKKYAIFIDEINRGNISKILGELITLIETDKRIKWENGEIVENKDMVVKLPYSGDEFGVPKNIDIIGTMNSADRSTAVLDSALRRRFKFEKMMPNPEEAIEKKTIPDGKSGEINLVELLNKMNQRITRLLHEDQTIGHSYFCKINNFDELKNVFVYEILPLLQEYFYDDYEQIRLVLDSQLVEELPTNTKELFPNSENVNLGSGKAFKIASPEEITPDSIRAIYEEKNDLPDS